MLEDNLIISKLQHGDKKMFEAVFKSYYACLIRYAYSILNDYDSSEEVVQDLFFRLWHNRKKLSITSTLKGYLYTSTRNSCIHHINHNKVIKNHVASVLNNNETMNDQVNEGIYYSELLLAVETVLGSLPERAAKIFEMNRFEGKTYNDIANILSISVKTVEADMGKALKVFRQAFSKI